MKKNIFILAMVAIFVSANVMAQTSEPKKAETKKECCTKGEKKDCKGDKTACKSEAKGACCDKKATPAKK